MGGIMLAAIGGGKEIRLIDKAVLLKGVFGTAIFQSPNYSLNMTWSDAGDSNTAFSYAISRKSGSTKLSVNSVYSGAVNNGNSSGTSRTPAYALRADGLSSGESVTAIFEIVATYAGYQAGVASLTVTASNE